jgi:hypothetical protein
MSRTASGARVTQREREMRGLLAECERSGLSKSVFARKRKLNPGTFAWWSSEIRRREARRSRKREPEAATPSFVDVVVRSDEPTPLVFEVEINGGRVVRIPAGFATEDLSRLLMVVEGRC